MSIEQREHLGIRKQNVLAEVDRNLISIDHTNALIGWNRL